MTRAPEGATRPRRIGVFGGTFDPPHLGHVAVARDVADALDLDQVLWIPANVPPHKAGEAISPPHVRRAMTVAATAADPRFGVSDVELERPGPSFTVDTLRRLHDADPDAEYFLLLGADQVRTLATGWREPEEVLRLATLVLMDRDGASARAVAPDLPGMEGALQVPVTRIDVSSSSLRDRVAAGEDVTEHVPVGVGEIIRRERLYTR